MIRRHVASPQPARKRRISAWVITLALSATLPAQAATTIAPFTPRVFSLKPVAQLPALVAPPKNAARLGKLVYSSPAFLRGTKRSSASWSQQITDIQRRLDLVEKQLSASRAARP